MAMVFTLATHLREATSALVAQRVVDKQRAADEKHQREEDVRRTLHTEIQFLPADRASACRTNQALAERLKGTQVTRESFLAWREKFQAELKAKREKEEEEKLRSLPPKERDEIRKSKNKLTGGRCFSRNALSWNLADRYHYWCASSDRQAAVPDGQIALEVGCAAR